MYVPVYSDDVIVFSADPGSRVSSICILFQRLRRHNLKLSSAKSHSMKAIDDIFLSRFTTPSGVSLDASKVAALAKMSMPKDANNYAFHWAAPPTTGNFSLCQRNSLSPELVSEKGIKFDFTSRIRDTVPPGCWSSLLNLFRPFLDEKMQVTIRTLSGYAATLYIDDFGATLEQEQLGGIARPIATSAEVPFKRRETGRPSTSRLAPSSGASKAYVDIYGDPNSRCLIARDTNIGKGSEHNTSVQRWIEFLIVYKLTLHYCKGNANGNADFSS